MLDVDTLNQSVRHYVAQVTGLDQDTAVRKADQDAPVGDIPFATVKITPLIPEGQDQVTYEDRVADVDLDEKRQGTRQLLASINFYGDGAINNAIKMQGSAHESANQDFLRARFLGFINASEYRDLTGIELARYEQRAQLDMFFYVIDDNENIVSSVQQQDIEANVDDYTNVIEVRP